MMAPDRRTLVVKGKIFTDLGEGASFTRLPWVREEFIKRVGIDPYPGTLNIWLEDDEILQQVTCLKNLPGIIIPPGQEGFCSAKCFKVTAGGIPGAVVFPAVPGYPLEKFEMIFPVNMKETLGIQDGDLLTVEIER
jgi:CTP-dependent riboflavin kinase